MALKNPAPGATGDGAGFGTRAAAECGPKLAESQGFCPDLKGGRTKTGALLDRERLGAAGIIVRLMRECEALRAENQRLRIAVRGFDIQPESPFRLLSGAEVVNILHPEAHQPAVDNLDDTTRAKRAIARVTHEFARQARPAAEIKAAVLAEAERGGVSSEDALAISASIIREKVAGGRCDA